VFHVKQLRNLSERPQLVVSDLPTRVGDRTDATDVGIGGPFGRHRLVTALPLNKAGGPLQLVPARVIHDSALCYLGDPDGNLVGDRSALWVHRMVTAKVTRNTRRL
jgi:hypothetical protein